MRIRGIAFCGVAALVFAGSIDESAALAGVPAIAIRADSLGENGRSDIHLARAAVRRGGRVNVQRAPAVNVRRAPTVNVNRGPTVVVRRPVQVWAPRPYYGRLIAGVALGAVVAAATVGTVPSPPAPGLCWFWSDASLTWGYWDYCVPPR